MLKKISCIILAVLMLFTVFCVKKAFSFDRQIERYYESVTSSVNNVLIYDLDGDEVLFAKREAEKISMGSVVKLVTALTAFEILSPEESFVVGEEVDYYLTADASRSMIKNGQTVNFETLLYALLLPSGCDAANTIAVNSARRATGNSEMPVEEALSCFVSLMNSYAKSIGCTDCSFVNPDGQDADGQYMTLEDVLLIAKKVLSNELILKITGTAKYEITLYSEDAQDSYEWENTNKLLNEDGYYYYEYAKGLKTGYTLDAGYTLASFAERNGHRVLCVMAKCSSDAVRFNVAPKLFQLAFADCENN